MLNVCNVIRPAAIIVMSLAVISVILPGFLEQYWPYLAAAAVLIVPMMVYRWWDSRYNPGCSVNFRSQPDPLED